MTSSPPSGAPPSGAPLFVGLDVGTSGVRAVAVGADGREAGAASKPMTPPKTDGPRITQEPAVWWEAVREVLRELGRRVGAGRIAAIAVDGTSGTALPIDRDGRPLAPAAMYNDGASVREAARVKAVAPAGSGAQGASSALAKLLAFHARDDRDGLWRVVHQADWIAGSLAGRHGLSDENNALKMGFDVVERRWPDWFDALDVDRDLLPEVLVPGDPVGAIDPAVAADLGLPSGTRVIAGTTDGVAAFLATGADRLGDGVTSLGSTLVVKLLADRPVFDSDSGVYSHRLGDRWLPGGASNSGGSALLRFFTAERMAELTPRLDPARPTGLDFYPLPGEGERFPVNDPGKRSLTEPRPADDAAFFQALLEGIASVEARAYARLAELGAPRLRSIRSVGGGARNAAWTAIREARLGVASAEVESGEAARGAARLAREGHERLAETR